mgnify:CR=1 FL=1
MVDTVDLAWTWESTIQGYIIALLVSACVDFTHITILFKWRVMLTIGTIDVDILCAGIAMTTE